MRYGPNSLKRKTGRSRVVQNLGGNVSHIPIQQRRVFCVLVEQGLNIGHQRDVARAGRFEESALL